LLEPHPSHAERCKTVNLFQRVSRVEYFEKRAQGAQDDKVLRGHCSHGQVHPNTVCTSSRSRHPPNNVDFAGLKIARVMVSWRLLPRFQRKAQEVRQMCVQCWGSCNQILTLLVCGAERVKLKLQRRSQEVKDARNVEHLLREAAGSQHSQPGREAMWAATSKVIGARAAHTLKGPHPASLGHEFWT
jgi:hypothetical protein